MKRPVLIVGSVVLIAGLACAVGFMSMRPAWPTVEFGPHKADIAWIPYEATAVKPFMNFSLFGRRIIYPASHPKVKESHPDFHSGFIRVSSGDFAYLVLPNGDRVWLQNDLLAVPWARSPGERNYVLRVIDSAYTGKLPIEEIHVKAPYMAGKGTSLYGPVRAKIAGLDFEGTIARFNHLGCAFLYGHWAGAWLEKGRVLSEYGQGSSLTYLTNAPSPTFTLIGQKQRNGEIVFKGFIAADNLKRRPFEFTVRPEKGESN